MEANKAKQKKKKLLIDPIFNKRTFADHIKFLFISQKYKLSSKNPDDLFNVAFLTDNNKFNTFYFRDYKDGNKTLKYFREICKEHLIDNKTEIIFNEIKETSFVGILFDIIERCTGNFHGNIDIWKMLSTINRYYSYSIFPEYKRNKKFFKNLKDKRLDEALIRAFYYVKNENDCPWMTDENVIHISKNINKRYKPKAEKNGILLCLAIFYMAVRKYLRNTNNKSAFKNTKLER